MGALTRTQPRDFGSVQMQLLSRKMSDLMPELPRDEKGRIQTADNLRIRPEKHLFEPGDKYNPRHHEQHYHVETQRTPGNGWSKKNTEKVKPPDYYKGNGQDFDQEKLTRE